MILLSYDNINIIYVYIINYNILKSINKKNINIIYKLIFFIVNVVVVFFIV